ncbi:uncharacterized protein [Argopecten irradians]|uniref:uncharacterized protein n=1 Tax=Argopecten irradians TaxID=31199 RepID=UPI00371928D1
MWKERAEIFAISSLLIIQYIGAENTISLNEHSCGNQIYDLDYHQRLSVEWRGQILPKTCRVGVRGVVDSVTICFDVTAFRVENCGLSLEIYKPYSVNPLKVYSCNELHQKERFCRYREKTLFMKFSSNYISLERFEPNVRISIEIDPGDLTGLVAPEKSSPVNIVGFIFGFLFFCVIVALPFIRKMCCTSGQTHRFSLRDCQICCNEMYNERNYLPWLRETVSHYLSCNNEKESESSQHDTEYVVTPDHTEAEKIVIQISSEEYTADTTSATDQLGAIGVGSPNFLDESISVIYDEDEQSDIYYSLSDDDNVPDSHPCMSQKTISVEHGIEVLPPADEYHIVSFTDASLSSPDDENLTEQNETSV